MKPEAYFITTARGFIHDETALCEALRDKRIAGAEAVGAHKTSMLQDLEAGRPLELETLVGSVIELARLIDQGHLRPQVGAVYPLAQAAEAYSAKAAGGIPGRIILQP